MIDKTSTKYNANDSIFIQSEDETIKINKRDLVYKRIHNHEHHYLPDFEDETDDYIALKCAKSGCLHGMLMSKGEKSFMSWLEKHRAKS